jgi:hypothetical protein
MNSYPIKIGNDRHWDVTLLIHFGTQEYISAQIFNAAQENVIMSERLSNPSCQYEVISKVAWARQEW